MSATDLNTLLRDVEELRRAVRRNSPFLREVISSRLFAAYALAIGLAATAFCLASQILIGWYGSFPAIPQGWKTGFWSALVLLGAAAVVSKPLIIGRRAAEVDTRATFITVIKVLYGGLVSNIYAPAFLCMVAASAFAVTIGHPWYIVPAIAVFYTFAANGVGLFVQRPEYFASGWYALAAGIASVFFLERAPFIWTAVVAGGMCLIFGMVSLIWGGGRRGGKDGSEARNAEPGKR
ncbi:MAG: hypothetical protein ABSB63_07145 [Spirochaetia bacterium]